MTNTEVEDVLASIRRLVSDNKRPEPPKKEAAVADRLVLTPSLRVMDDESKDAPDPSAPPAADALDAPDPNVSETVQSDVVEPDHAPDAVELDAVEPETQIPADFEQGDVAQENAIEPDTASFDAHAPEDDTSADAYDAVDDQSTSDADERVDLHLVESSSAVDGQDVSSVSDGTPDAQADLDAWPVDDAQNDVKVPEEWAVDDTPIVEDYVPDYSDGFAELAAANVALSLSEKVAALEKLVGKRSDNFEADDLNVGANAGTEPPAMEWEDADTEEHTDAEEHTCLLYTSDAADE